VSSLTFIALLVILVFAIDLGARWWRENQWRRRRRDDDD
jgi:hypothetical protein